MIVDITLEEGGIWIPVKTNVFSVIRFFASSELGEYKPAALKWKGVIFDTVLKQLGYNPIRKQIA